MRSSLAEYVFHILYQSDDVEKAIPSVLEIVGRHVGVSRVYIFEDSEDGTYCDNTFEWCNDGIVPQIDQLQHMLEGELADYYKNFNETVFFTAATSMHCPRIRCRFWRRKASSPCCSV